MVVPTQHQARGAASHTFAKRSSDSYDDVRSLQGRLHVIEPAAKSSVVGGQRRGPFRTDHLDVRPQITTGEQERHKAFVSRLVHSPDVDYSWSARFAPGRELVYVHAVGDH